MGESWYSIGLCTTIIYKNIQDVRYYFVRRFYSHCLSPCDLDIFICSASKTIHTDTSTNKHIHMHIQKPTHTHIFHQSICTSCQPKCKHPVTHTHAHAHRSRNLRPDVYGPSAKAAAAAAAASASSHQSPVSNFMPTSNYPGTNYILCVHARACVCSYTGYCITLSPPPGGVTLRAPPVANEVIYVSRFIGPRIFAST